MSGRLEHALVRAVDSLGKWLYRRAPLPPEARWALADGFFRIAAPLVRESASYRSWRRERDWRGRQRSAARSGAAREWCPAAASGRGRDVWLFSGIDWDFRWQRPQHLALGLARLGHRVFFVSPLFLDDRRPGFSAEAVDAALPVHAVRLRARGRPILYRAPIPSAAEAQLQAGLAACREHARSRDAIAIVQHPGWLPLARAAAGAGLVYDWLDDHAAFDEVGDHVESLERELIGAADLVIASAESLEARARAAGGQRVARIPNGVDTAHFAAAPDRLPGYAGSRKVIGYFGAVAAWLDVDLLRAVARRFGDCLLVLVGADEGDVLWQLRDLPNVVGISEVAYAQLPVHLHAMDVCLVPFLLTPLTRAIDPVKVYESLAAGKPVVATALPELRALAATGLLRLADDEKGFLDGVEEALREHDPAAAERRRQFARANSWAARAAALDALLAELGGERGAR